MNVIDPATIKNKKQKAKLTGGEDFDAEPRASKPSDGWLDAQRALLKLTIRKDRGYGNYLPQLDGQQTAYSRDYFWDQDEGKYYAKNWLSFRVAYRYYKGKKRRSYLFWPKHVEPSYIVNSIVTQAGQVIRVTTVSGWADYANLGRMDFNTPREEVNYNPSRSVLALWRSSGTMKPRKREKEKQEALFALPT